jgi:hypothetical protein
MSFLDALVFTFNFYFGCFIFTVISVLNFSFPGVGRVFFSSPASTVPALTHAVTELTHSSNQQSGQKAPSENKSKISGRTQN